MRNRIIALLGGVSAMALATTAVAQETQSPLGTFLGTITLIFGGQENIESTGGAVVTEEDIEALQPADVSELFARESAVNVSGGAGPSKRIHVFGIEQSKLAVTVDGVPQFGTGWHHTGSNVIDPTFLKSVEVEAGAAADAGFGAAAGAVRYTTVGAQDMLEEGQAVGGRAALSYGSNGRGVAGSLAGYGRANGFDWFLMIYGSGGDNYKSGDGAEIPGTEPASQGALAKFGYEVDTHRIELSLEHSKDEADRVIKMNMDLNHDPTVYPLKVTRDTLSLKYTSTAPTDGWDPEALFYISQSGYWRPNYAAARNGDMDLDAKATGGKLQNTFTMGAGKITAGIDFAYEDFRVDNYGDTPATHPRIWNFSTMQVGAYVQGRFEFDNGIDLSTGMRYDHHRLNSFDGARFTGSGASVNGTISYEFADGFEVFAGASETWLGYDMGEYGLLHARTTSFHIDPAYKPATATNYKVGLNANGEVWSGGLTFFDTRLKDVASYDTSAAVNAIVNSGEMRSKGFTLNGHYGWDTGRVGVSFTKADVTVDGVFALADGSAVMPIGDTASIYIDQDLPSLNMKVGATVEWAGTLSDPVLTAAGFKDHSSYTVVNTYAEWSPPAVEDLTVRFAVDNLLDETYYERSSYIERVAGARQIHPLYAPGRTVSLGVNLKF
ncbi:TonB-dependent receptor [Rhodobacter sp.]